MILPNLATDALAHKLGISYEQAWRLKDLETVNADLLAALEQAADDINTLGENLRHGLSEAALSLVGRFEQAARAAIARAHDTQRGIAAAPDLLAALEEIGNGSAIMLAFEWREVAERMQKIARAAITRARAHGDCLDGLAAVQAGNERLLKAVKNSGGCPPGHYVGCPHDL